MLVYVEVCCKCAAARPYPLTPPSFTCCSVLQCVAVCRSVLLCFSVVRLAHAYEHHLHSYMWGPFEKMQGSFEQTWGSFEEMLF